LVAGNISFQIRNIASLLVSEIPSDRGCAPFVAGAVIGGIALGLLTQSGVGLVVGAAAGLAIAFYLVGSPASDYQLQLLTNAATSFRIVHKDEQFLLRLKNAIEEVMQRGDNSVAYHVNIAEQKIDRLEANTAHVSHSPGAAIVGGSATNVSLSTHVIVQGLQDVDALLKIVERSNAANGDLLKAHLQVVQQYLAGTRTKEEAKSAWAKFVEHAGLIANTGNNVWELVAKIGLALA
jgi:uncharacterized protein DUF6232